MLTRGGLINEKQLENGRNAQNTTQKYIIKVNICL